MKVLTPFLLLHDINGLKLYNDALNHQKGDSVLIKVAEILKENQIENTHVYRIGGDEFVYITKLYSEAWSTLEKNLRT